MTVPPPTDPQEYLIKRLFEDRGNAQIADDDERVADLAGIIAAVQQHSPSHGLVDAHSPRTCVYDNHEYPCASLKLNARPYRGRDDFLKSLL